MARTAMAPKDWRTVLLNDLGPLVSPHTRDNYLRSVGKLIQYSGKERRFSRADFTGFFSSLIEEGKSQATLSAIFAAITRYLEAINERAPITLRQLGVRSNREDQHRPGLTKDELEALVDYGRRQQGVLEAHLAMATVYGLRRSELAILNADSFDLSAGLVKLATVKHQVTRRHRLPAAIVEPVKRGLKQDSFHPRHISAESMVFSQAVDAVLPRHHKGPLGWHSIRRSLNSELLLAGVPELHVKSFFGWGATSMPQHYFRPGEVAADMDAVIFEHHPYLKFWH